MLEDIHAAISLGFLLAFLIGPVFFVLLETAAVKGFRAALALDIGVILADLLFIFIAYFSTNQILEKLKDDPGLYIFGGVILTVYGIISFIKERNNYHKLRDTTVEIINKHNYLILIVKGFVLNFINVGVLGFWVGVIIVIGPQLDMDTNRMISFFGMVLLSYLAVDIFKILLAKRLRKKLTPKRTYIIKRLISIILVISGLVLIMKGLLPDKMEKRLHNEIEKIAPVSML